MSKKKLADLEAENKMLKANVLELQAELDNLNENTVISSMNDMRDRYNFLVESSVCQHRYASLKYQYKRCLGICKTVENVTNLIFDKLMQLNVFLDQYTPNRTHYVDDVHQSRIKNDVILLRDRIQLILELLDTYVDDYEDTCDVEHCEIGNGV
ncbi:hypothetical protein EB118_10700 [bacterium]|nr:hypothetical protein [bacterium]NDG30526.1 hypothetical protein [bacterium]